MEKSYYKDFFELEKTHWLFVVRRKIILYFIKKYAKNGAKIFDFGCGSGYLVAVLQKIGYSTYGADFESEAIDYGKKQGIVNIEVTGENLPHPDSMFDMITAFDVLEHIKDEKPVIKEFIRVLKPGGKIIITVPAYQWLWGVQDEVSHHFRRYTIKSLTRVLREFPNFKIREKTYFNTFLFPPIAVVRLFSKWFNIKDRKSDFDIKTGFLDTFLYFMFNLETYLLRFVSFPFGVSILVVLEKDENF